MKHERVAFIVMPRCFGKEFRMMAEILDIVNSGGKACIIRSNGRRDNFTKPEDVMNWWKEKRG